MRRFPAAVLFIGASVMGSGSSDLIQRDGGDDAGRAPAIPSERPRVRELGLSPGILPPGALNAITDVAGVRIGHVTIIEGEDVRTGVTAILPHNDNPFQRKVRAAVHVGNGFGKAAGFLQVQELGTIETPIILTNTLSVGTAIEATVRWTLGWRGNEGVRSVNAVVGETNDGSLNDITGMHVNHEHVFEAIRTARDGEVDEGCVGAGTGTVAFGFKGGIGTASRKLPESLGGYTLGALVQANFGGVLSIDGLRIGEALGRYSFRREIERSASEGGMGFEPDGGEITPTESPDGSIMIILATDAPVSSRQLERIARRAVMGLARTGSFMSHGSGDFVIAFTTANTINHASGARSESVEFLREEALSPLFLATVEAVEEAIYNAILRAETMTGRGGTTIEALPIERLRTMIESRERE